MARPLRLDADQPDRPLVWRPVSVKRQRPDL